MTRKRSLVGALEGIEDALRMLRGAVSGETRTEDFQYGIVLRQVEESVDALVLADLLRRPMSRPLQLILEVLGRDGEQFGHWEAIVDEVGDQDTFNLVMAEFVRGVPRFEGRDGWGLLEYRSVGRVRLKPHLLGVVEEFIRES